MTNNSNRLDVRFRFQPKAKSLDGVLFGYLKPSRKNIVYQEMILKALRAFWLPEAYRQTGEKKGQALKKLAQDMIFMLEEHANYLRSEFGIARPMIETVHPANSDFNLPEQDSDNEAQAVEAWTSAEGFDVGDL
jgi:hypothetical protein